MNEIDNFNPSIIQIAKWIILNDYAYIDKVLPQQSSFKKFAAYLIFVCSNLIILSIYAAVSLSLISIIIGFQFGFQFVWNDFIIFCRNINTTTFFWIGTGLPLIFAIFWFVPTPKNNPNNSSNGNTLAFNFIFLLFLTVFLYFCKGSAFSYINFFLLGIYTPITLLSIIIGIVIPYQLFFDKEKKNGISKIGAIGVMELLVIIVAFVLNIIFVVFIGSKFFTYSNEAKLSFKILYMLSGTYFIIDVFAKQTIAFFIFISDFLNIPPTTLENNIYRTVGTVSLFMSSRMTNILLSLGLKDVEKASVFLNYLKTYKYNENDLILKMQQVVTIGIWYKNIDKMKNSDRPEFFDITLPLEGLLSVNEKQKLSIEWVKEIININDIFENLKENDGYKSLKEELENHTINDMDKLIQTTQLTEFKFNWIKQQYIDVFKALKHGIQYRIDKLEQKSKELYPWGENPYFPNDAIPTSKNDLFLGREDIINDLERVLWSNGYIPSLLILGQRRIGKTSLIRHLPTKLSKKHKVISLDLQAAGTVSNFYGFCKEIKDTVTKNLSLQKRIFEPESKDNWIDCWKQTECFLNSVAEEQSYKLLIVLDEYEELHNLFSKDSEQANSVLKAIRSYTNSQKKVVFIFVGAAYFDDLESPTWVDKLVSVEILKVDYLDEDSIKTLFTSPTPQLQYDKNALLYIYEQTQGHPALAQELASEIVEHMKSETKPNVSKIIVENVVNNRVLTYDRCKAADVFWIEFCKDEVYRKLLKDISNKKRIKDENIEIRIALQKLEKYKFILLDEKSKRWKWRVPLMEEWCKKFKYDSII